MKRNISEIDFILNQETALEVKIKANQADVDKLQKLTGAVSIVKCFVISKKYSETEQVLFPSFFFKYFGDIMLNDMKLPARKRIQCCL